MNRSFARRGGALATAAVVVLAALMVRCGGTTGKEGLTVPETPDSAPPDLDAGLFDVDVPFADRVIPDVTPVQVPDAASHPWPDCPTFLPVDGNGQVVDPNDGGYWVDQVPSVAVDDAGTLAFAPDGSACATYPWLGSLAVDRCLTSNSGDTFIDLPPCNWAKGAGTAQAGTRAGSKREDLCYELYDCIVKSGCAVSNVAVCLCGPDTNADVCSKNPAGACATEELAALELTDKEVGDALKDMTDTVAHPVAGKLNQMFQTAETYFCFGADGGP
jgi:hypothetical protein